MHLLGQCRADGPIRQSSSASSGTGKTHAVSRSKRTPLIGDERAWLGFGRRVFSISDGGCYAK